MLFKFSQPCLKLAANFCRQRSVVAFRQPSRYGGRIAGSPAIREPGVFVRYVFTNKGKEKRQIYAIYLVSLTVVFTGLSFLAVPLYRAFCQKAGIGGVVQRGHNVSKIAKMTPVENRPLTIEFTADKGAAMKWNFKPLQSEIKIVPGETALAFYRARNPTDKPIIGISTYNVLPFEAGLYFNKIQCFCFEEQRLNPGEEVDMPVFFYVDPDIMENPRLAFEDRIVLSYTFFEAKEEEVDKFLEILQRERGEDLEKARGMAAKSNEDAVVKAAPELAPIKRSKAMEQSRNHKLERAMAGLSAHPAANPKTKADTAK
ncbi:cytochrome c oxidase assembly protein COX11, mitochondrial-like isoform X2 [Sycon ciliatum]|uniref:cytochrome c oxidase assembly protein COX11, mitochondrial-like isoform X2 n=1 Tax=Sycon ciliatum TaxID=27933 RepID=UPI0020A909A1|eukprot:scpid85240/ scgid31535/ Cytochrome c oxidase assembly protein COX11, mitochondrial